MKLHSYRSRSFRAIKPVSDYILIPSATGDSFYYLCPTCRILLPREYMHFCDHCGQHLGWITYLPCRRKTFHIPGSQDIADPSRENAVPPAVQK